MNASMMSHFEWMRTAAGAVRAVALAAALTAAGVAASAPAPAQSAGGARVEREADAKAQLKKADEARRAVKGTGAERRALTEKAEEAYGAVLSLFPDAKAEGALASFRMGELRRRLGKVDGARESFAKVISIGADRKLSARAVLETGHLYRRSKELGKALEAYRRTATEFADEAGTRDDALYWVGTIHEQAKEHSKAREAWRAVAERGADPVDRVRAFDRVALSFLKEGMREDATKTVEAARAALADAAAEPSALGARVKKALERLRAVKALEKPAKPGTKGGGGAPEDDDDSEDDDDEDL